MIADRAPDADGRQHFLRRQRERIAAPVERVLFACLRRQGVDNRDRLPRIRKGQPKGRAVQAPTHDDDI